MTARRYSPESQCRGKVRYETKAEAKEATRRTERTLGRMHAYRCDCGWFHIGHRPKHPYDWGTS